MSNGIEDACQISELHPCDEQPSQASLNYYNEVSAGG